MVSNLFGGSGSKKLFGGSEKGFTSSTAPTGFGSLPGFGQDAFKQAVARGTELSQDPSIFAPAGLTGGQQQALGALQSGLGPTSPEQFQTGLATFGDPFEEQVVQNAIRDIQETGAGQLSDIGSFASAAGGFGGTRQALLESELQRNIQRNVGDVSSGLRSQGFQAAADRTLNDISRGQSLAAPLFQFGDVQRQIQTQQQQSPLQAINFLAQLAQGLPVGGGGTSSGVSGGSFGGLIPGLTGAAKTGATFA